MTFLEHVNAHQPISGLISSASIPMSFPGIDLEVVRAEGRLNSNCSSGSCFFCLFLIHCLPQRYFNVNVPSLSLASPEKSHQKPQHQNYMEFPEFHSSPIDYSTLIDYRLIDHINSISYIYVHVFFAILI